MPRYFFHVLRGRSRLEDPVGTELPNLDAARNEASEDARAFMSSDVRNGIDRSRNAAIEITDETGKVLVTFPFRDALQVVD